MQILAALQMEDHDTLVSASDIRSDMIVIREKQPRGTDMRTSSCISQNLEIVAQDIHPPQELAACSLQCLYRLKLFLLLRQLCSHSRIR